MDASRALPLIRLIYEAALEPARWQDFVQALSDAYGGVPTGFALQLPGFPLSGVFYVAGFYDPAYRERFVEHALQGLPWEAARRHHFVGRFGRASEVIDRVGIEASAFYREWMQPQGLSPYGPIGHTIALEDGLPLAGIAIFTPADRPPFGDEELAFGDLLVPHLALAYRIHAETCRHRALSGAIDRFPTGVLLLDARGQVLRRNLAAQRILELDDGLSERDGVLRAADAEDEATLRALVEEAVAAGSRGERGHSRVHSVRRQSGKRAFPLLVSPLRSESGDATLTDAVAVVYVAALERGVLHRRGVLRELYGLTEAESQLVELLCQGCSLEEAAATRGVKMNTARSQLKQVFAKTHTSRQSELVRLVLAGVAPIGGPEDA